VLNLRLYEALWDWKNGEELITIWPRNRELQIAEFDVYLPGRMYTYVNPAKIRSINPGYCFKQAGWRNARNPDGTVYVSKAGQHLLVKFDAEGQRREPQ
jgi:hypothetical protein